jgi:ABC-type Fe3+-siderophore transport system permease subunit
MALFLIAAVGFLFVLFLVLTSNLGTIRPILSIALIGMIIYFLIEFVTSFLNQRSASNNTQDAYRKQIQALSPKRNNRRLPPGV